MKEYTITQEQLEKVNEEYMRQDKLNSELYDKTGRVSYHADIMRGIEIALEILGFEVS